LRILICHGYLLKGTGSNQYVQSFARSLCRQGHNSIVFCQDDDPRLDFVSSFVMEEPGIRLRVAWEQEIEYPGSCMVFRPDIGDLLPVYVCDSYPGFHVKEFPDLDERELRDYVERNRASLSRLVKRFSPEAIQVNHTVMLPCIVRPIAEEAGVPYFVTVHGSAIEFAVKKDRRYLDCGAEGLAGAKGIIVLSEHSGDVVREVFGGMVEGLDEKVIVVPPGVDTGFFRPDDRSLSEAVETLLEAVEERTGGVRVGDFVGHAREGPPDGGEEVDDDVEWETTRINALHPDWLPESDISTRLREMAAEGRPFLQFVGKLLETKGIQCVLPALPLIMRDYPRACLVVVGFGELRGILELMLGALDRGDVRVLTRLCEYANARYTLADSAFTPVLTFLDELAGEGSLDEYLRLCRGLDLAGSVIFTGYLAPEEHRHLMPHARAALVPSIAPEAFGLVAIEAMACGVVPVASLHSGLRDALEPAAEAWGREAESLFLGTREKFVFRIAAAARKVMGMPEDALRYRGELMREAVKSRFSWDAVSTRMIQIMGSGLES